MSKHSRKVAASAKPNAQSVATGQAAAKKRSNIGSNIIIAVLSLALLIGVGVIAYPSFSNWFNRLHQSRAVASYVEATENITQQKQDEMLQAAHQYNQNLLQISDRWHLNKEQQEQYNKTLDVTGTGIMGYISIPNLSVRLPVYHGTDETVLQIAVGHQMGTSLPVGGETTHAVVSGHTGLPSAKLLTGLDKLKTGDQFYMTVFNNQYWYEVDEINVVLPDELDKLNIENGKDYMTLVTCTPYGINSHRLLVRGHAIPTPPQADATQYDDANRMRLLTIAAIGLLLLIIILVTIWLVRRRAKKRAAALSAK